MNLGAGYREGLLLCTCLCTQLTLTIASKLLKLNGGVDGTRTRGLCRDRAAFEVWLLRGSVCFHPDTRKTAWIQGFRCSR